VAFQSLQPAGNFDYKWDLVKTVNQAEEGTTPTVRIQKGVQDEVAYHVEARRTPNADTIKATLSGEVIITPDADVVISAATLSVGSAAGGVVPTTVDVTACAKGALKAGVPRSCPWKDAVYNGKTEPGFVQATITYNTDPPAAPPPPSFASQQEPFTPDLDKLTARYATALLTDKADLKPFTDLYAGFTGFAATTVWRETNPDVAIPDAGVTISGDKTFE
jgi:hypothetical protein